MGVGWTTRENGKREVEGEEKRGERDEEEGGAAVAEGNAICCGGRGCISM